MPSKRLEPKERTAQILNAAIEVAKAKGYDSITRDDVAAKAKCSIGLISLRWTTMAALKRAVMREAVKNSVLPIIAQGIVARDSLALNAPTRLKKLAVATLA
jgi:AcrR family transcriptional regulator